MEIVPVERIASKIYLIRNTKVILDRDLAELYGVETRVLNQSVSRNIDRFPDDFMFSLTREEIMSISQIVTSSRIKFAKRVLAFTEQGVAMLSGVLNSKQAIQVNIQIMRTFTRLRRTLLDNKDFRKELEELKQITEERFQVVFETLDQLLTVESRPKKKIGFTVKEEQAAYGKKKSKKTCKSASN